MYRLRANLSKTNPKANFYLKLFLPLGKDFFQKIKASGTFYNEHPSSYIFCNTLFS